MSEAGTHWFAGLCGQMKGFSAALQGFRDVALEFLGDRSGIAGNQNWRCGHLPDGSASPAAPLKSGRHSALTGFSSRSLKALRPVYFCDSSILSGFDATERALIDAREIPVYRRDHALARSHELHRWQMFILRLRLHPAQQLAQAAVRISLCLCQGTRLPAGWK